MNKIILFLACLLFIVFYGFADAASCDPDLCAPGEAIESFPFYVYQDASAPDNHFFPTGYMGDFDDLRIDFHCKDNPYSGDTCIKITYRARARQGTRWVGFYWQYPASNWGGALGGYDLSRAKRLTFWARGEKGKEVINSFRVGGIMGQYRDTGRESIGPIKLSKEWLKYTIEFKNMKNQIRSDFKLRSCCPGINPLTRIVGGFGWATNSSVNSGNISFYIDEIRFEN
ncbi:MAG: hypothetical protein WCY12_04475 [Candidatus Omnitrophota bacterium]|jgi:hypothetical protein